MKIYFLKHSAFAVDTGKRRLVFDYFCDEPAGGTLEQGVVTPELLTDKPLVVFASHFHKDHYDKLILSWVHRHPDCTLYLGRGIRSKEVGRIVKPYEEFEQDGVHIRTLRSTDSGVAFLIQTDGFKIYHAGDLNWWHWAEESEQWNQIMAKRYQKEVLSLAGESIDLAFLPTDPRQGADALRGASYFLEHVSVRHWVPIHCWGEQAIYDQITAAPELQPYQKELLLLRHRGQSVEVF